MLIFVFERMVKEAEDNDKQLLELRARYMDSGRIRRSCTIEKKPHVVKSRGKTLNTKKVVINL